jgi:hypothetical protein
VELKGLKMPTVDAAPGTKRTLPSGNRTLPAKSDVPVAPETTFPYTGAGLVHQYDKEGFEDALHVAEIHDWIAPEFAELGSK